MGAMQVKIPDEEFNNIQSLAAYRRALEAGRPHYTLFVIDGRAWQTQG